MYIPFWYVKYCLVFFSEGLIGLKIITFNYKFYKDEGDSLVP